MQVLTEIPPVHEPHHVQTLFERCQQLQSLANIVLPEKYGKVIDEPGSPVFLLRLSARRVCRVRIRIRDSQGKLHLPGEGSMIFSTVDNGQPVQHKRSAASERALVHQLQTELNLEHNSTSGQVSFERGLHLIEQLEQRAHAIEVLWDAQSEAPIRSLGTLTSKNVRVTISQKRDWFQLNGLCDWMEAISI